MSKTAKLHETIVSSSIWGEEATTCKVWITMLATARNGNVLASVGGLAHLARVTPAECQTALTKFLSPDPDSRTKDDEGRRIREIAGGWFILNYRKYSGGHDEEKRREAARLRMQRHRVSASKTAPVTPKRREHERTRANTSEQNASSEQQDFALAGIELKPAKPGAAKAASGRLPTSDEAKRIAAMFHRKPTTPWTKEEIQKFTGIGPIDAEDLALLERYYAAERAKGSDGCHRRDLTTFLNNFVTEIDRARGAFHEKRPAANPKHEDPEGWRTFLKEFRQSYEPHRTAMEVLKTRFEKWRKE